jgi:DNA-directed RNA polymerase specialized sigma24 family protein
MESENLGIRQIEKILSSEITDWLRWGRNRDYLPPSFRCPLGYLYVPKRGDLEANLYRRAPVNLLRVIEFERIIVSLPKKRRQAFVMHHLHRALVRGRVIETKMTASDYARLLGVSRTDYFTLLNQAHNLVLRKWQEQIKKKQQDP